MQMKSTDVRVWVAWGKAQETLICGERELAQFHEQEGPSKLQDNKESRLSTEERCKEPLNNWSMVTLFQCC